ncbi:histone deacetylase 11 [Ctenocephalides felis]|uniref:histone deacetylase 11 n=1 Tax=Ctenocephalides felis TaxID=7515 RepID=UPI000E6E5133|nr:histone deacetylase 11 [Ctenocephalides felis]
MLDSHSNSSTIIKKHQWPIIYHEGYNVHFMGLEKLHPFDASKWSNIIKYLIDSGMINKDSVIRPNEASKSDLLLVHTKRYLRKLKSSLTVSRIAEVPLLMFVPNCLVQSGYLRPMRLQTGGSIMAAKLACQQGWAINIGGGFHHCSSDRGGGFCPYADVTLLIKHALRDKQLGVKKVMIVDLDAHQGNGYQRDFLNDNQIYILDMFNSEIYPKDNLAKQAITRLVELKPFTKDNIYLNKLEYHMEEALSEFNPDLIVFIAGTDVLEGDSLGLLSVTQEGIIKRDEFMFKKARHNKNPIPIVMLTSGGYLKKTAKIIANSIINLRDQGLINSPEN